MAAILVESRAWCKMDHCESVGMGQWAWGGLVLEEFERKNCQTWLWMSIGELRFFLLTWH